MGEKADLKIKKVTPAKAYSAVTWTTSNKTVATVTTNGTVTDKEILYSGAYGNTTWTIDKDGLLEVKGTGDMYDRKNGKLPSWWRYGIRAAKIEVTGAANIRNLFCECNKLTKNLYHDFHKMQQKVLF